MKLSREAVATLGSRHLSDFAVIHGMAPKDEREAQAIYRPLAEFAASYLSIESPAFTVSICLAWLVSEPIAPSGYKDAYESCMIDITAGFKPDHSASPDPNGPRLVACTNRRRESNKTMDNAAYVHSSSRCRKIKVAHMRDGILVPALAKNRWVR